MPGTDRPLAGVRVLVTRPASQAGNLARSIRAAGGEPLPFPTLEIEPVAPPEAQIERLARSEAAIFISANAVEHGYPVLQGVGETGKRIFAIGDATKRALREAGCRNVHGPAGGASSSEELLAQPWLRNVENRPICIVRGRGGREALKETLASRGARVAYLECYLRRLPVDPDLAALARTLNDDPEGLVISVTSVAGLANLLKLAPREYAPRLRSCPLIVVGGRQKTSARRYGWTGPVLESRVGDEQIVETLITWRDQR